LPQPPALAGTAYSPLAGSSATLPMSSIRSLLAVLCRAACLWLVLGAFASAGELGWPLPGGLCGELKYSPAEEDLFASAEAGTLDAARLFDAALLAGGEIDPNNLARYRERFRHIVEQTQARCEREAAAGHTDRSPGSVQFGKAAAAMAVLHETVFIGSYDLNCSRPTDALDSGRFNCVSATILFNSLAGAIGLHAQAGEAPAHVVSVVATDAGPLLVETTCPSWFRLRAANRNHQDHGGKSRGEIAGEADRERDGSERPSSALQRSSTAGVTSRPSPTSVSSTRPFRLLGTRELVAMVYYNHGVEAAERRQFAAAVAANYKALRLDPGSATARSNLLAAINNWALDEADRGHPAEAIELLRRGLEVAPEHRSFAQNYLAIHQRWVQELFRRGELAEAARVLSRAVEEFPGEPYFAAARQQVAAALPDGGDAPSGSGEEAVEGTSERAITE